MTEHGVRYEKFVIPTKVDEYFTPVVLPPMPELAHDVFNHDHFCPSKPGLLCSNYLTVNGSRVSCIIASESLTSRPEAIRNYTLRYSIKDPLVRYSQILGQYDCKEEDFRNLNCEVQRFRNCGEVVQPEGVECQTAPSTVTASVGILN
ncbi:hypothetical protein QYM36_012481 [Artemia franciscana]|uniref:Uncharacterized protein n=1 Tax=Artemia franciscana TaxID=6661 RepID=A0AA88HP83_ARTSF|nr:hypothetical protein QYM36_012481 [Artemia franciscana]